MDCFGKLYFIMFNFVNFGRAMVKSKKSFSMQYVLPILAMLA